jgi:hypothetical protein
MLVAGMSRPGQEILWVSDQDPAFANEARENDTASVFGKLLTLFAPHKLGPVHYGTTASGAEPLFQEDLVAVPDLFCGATCEFFTSAKKEYGNLPRIGVKISSLDSRTHAFLKWYASGPWPLRRYICSIENRKGERPTVGILTPDLLWQGNILAAESDHGWPA